MDHGKGKAEVQGINKTRGISFSHNKTFKSNAEIQILMPKITVTLPDGSKKEFNKGISVAEVAKSIGPRLAKDALAAMIDGQFASLNSKLDKSCSLRILTFNDKEGQQAFWHTTSHVLAQAALELFPDAKRTIGPAIEEGFYYDFARKEPFHPEDLEKIEKKMQEIIKNGYDVIRKDFSIAEAKKSFKDNKYKLELIEEFSKGQKILSFYGQGSFLDLCKGGHIDNIGKIKAIKLLKVSSSYWRGDSKNDQLQRIYGISFPSESMLKEYLHRLEEAEKRDHRKIGKDLDLFSFHPESPGAPFFHPKGAVIYNALISFIRDEYKKRGYNEVITPLLYDKSLWETSGHWQHFRNDMFIFQVDGREASIKPMNCPSHCLIYKAGLKSYRDLPLRIADFAPLHRNELKGVLGGLTRVRKFSQDDSHAFVTEEQIEKEVLDIIDFAKYIYNDVFGFSYKIELSTKPQNAMGSPELWGKAEKALEGALKKKALKYTIKPGEGAFYGPKIDFHINDCLNRSWQLATIQLDFQMPLRFELSYEGSDGKKHTPIMIHKALLGSIERFIAILIEHYAGKFPLWLSPVQITILTVADRFVKYARELEKTFKGHGLRAEVDDRAESVGKKVREAQLQKIPIIINIGEKEESAKTVAVRTLDNNVKFGLKIDDFLKQVKENIEKKKQAITF